jgi:hypothetical protein
MWNIQRTVGLLLWLKPLGSNRQKVSLSGGSKQGKNQSITHGYVS